MSIINFSPSYEEQRKKIAERNADLEKQKDRFKYPKSNDSNEVLSPLETVSWTGESNEQLYFPVMNLDTDFNHAIAEHKYPDRDAARLESLGRESFTIKMSIPFINTLQPGLYDVWKAEELYPNTYNKMLLECLNSKTGSLKHPMFGVIKAKIISFSCSLDPKIRTGIILNIVFKETIDDALSATLETIKSKIASAKQTAKTLDETMPSLKPSPDDLKIPKHKDSLFDSVKKIENLIAYPGKTSQQLNNEINSLENRCKTSQQQIKKNYQNSWSQTNQLFAKLNADVKSFRETATNTSTYTNELKEFVTTTKTGLNDLLYNLKMTLEEYKKLNNYVPIDYFIPAGKVIRYFKKVS